MKIHLDQQMKFRNELNCRRVAIVAKKEARRQRYRLRRIPRIERDGLLAGLHQIAFPAHVHLGPGVAEIA